MRDPANASVRLNGPPFGEPATRLSPTASGVFAPFAILRQKTSSRLARHVPLARRRLVNHRPMVSFTFDDAAVSAGAIGAERIERIGGRATYYIASGLVGDSACGYPLMGRAQIRDLFRRGHEIGLHGHLHRPAGALSPTEFQDDLARNRQWLEAIDAGVQPTNFAYPYGFASFARKRRLYDLVASSRTVAPGVNVGVFDPQFLYCVELADGRVSRASLGAYLDEAVRRNGWLILCSHDVAEEPGPFGCSLPLFDFAMEGVARRSIEIVTIAAGLAKSRPVGRPLRENGSSL
jgi:peptidoglycan/xylan/chitin deacetylase (PgdA/CDA1 family)